MTQNSSKPFPWMPTEDRVVIKPDDAEEVTEGGILLPSQAREKPLQGTVIAVGPGKLLPDGRRGDMPVVVGDLVRFGRYSGMEHALKVEDEEETLTILRAADIALVLHVDKVALDAKKFAASLNPVETAAEAH